MPSNAKDKIKKVIKTALVEILILGLSWISEFIQDGLMRKSRLVWSKQKRLIDLFVEGSTARTAASLVGVNKATASDCFLRLRPLIDEHSEEAGFFAGEVERDERYFGGQRKGKRGRGVAGKVPVFGLLTRCSKVYAGVIADATWLPSIREKVKPDSLAYTDRFRGDNALEVSEFKHDWIHPGERFVEKPHPMKGIELVWSRAKRPLRKFNGIPRTHFHLSLKECEWRFNNSATQSSN